MDEDYFYKNVRKDFLLLFKNVKYKHMCFVNHIPERYRRNEYIIDKLIPKK